MNDMSYDNFFKQATGNVPYDYQGKLAGGADGGSCTSHLIDCLGPFHLAYLETLLRAADGRASNNT